MRVQANQVHLETLHAETQHLKATVDSLNKGQTSLSAKVRFLFNHPNSITITTFSLH